MTNALGAPFKEYSVLLFATHDGSLPTATSILQRLPPR
jgi:hypothetical protein